jgi:hypothetical protein
MCGTAYMALVSDEEVSVSSLRVPNPTQPSAPAVANPLIDNDDAAHLSWLTLRPALVSCYSDDDIRILCPIPFPSFLLKLVYHTVLSRLSSSTSASFFRHQRVPQAGSCGQCKPGSG